MAKRAYPYYAGREKYFGTKKCCACPDCARFVVTIQTSWFRGDDGEFIVCEAHANLARTDYGALSDLIAERDTYMRQIVDAQHEETGRRWKGERRALPPRYQEVSAVSEDV